MFFPWNYTSTDKTFDAMNIFQALSVFDLCHKISIYYQDKYNMCVTLFLGFCLNFTELNLVQSHEGCARCLVSLLAQVSHIQCERIAGYIALRTGREAAG